MVKAIRKPLEEIKQSVRAFDSVLVLGCGGCVSVCLAGGQKEANALRDTLARALKSEGAEKRVVSWTIERQCNLQFYADLDEKVKNAGCVLSMACGAGVQLLAEKYADKPVLPAVNTICIGIDRDIGLYEEKCRACGECFLGYTGGICPVARCAKGIFNGPCGGTGKEGNCEVDKNIPCAWADIYKRLKGQGRLDNILTVRPAKTWLNQTQRTLIQPEYEYRYVNKQGEPKP